MFAGSFSPTSNNWYNSFSRQAARWLDGYLDLGEYIAWLEIAVFEGRYFISFPPFPSIVMLPFVFFRGIDTPDHIIALAVSLLSLAYAYKIAIRVLGVKRHAMFMSLFLVLGTNYLHVALWGSVWYLAQNMAFLLMLMAFYYAMTSNKHHSWLSLLLMCAAMGTRPFNAVYLPVVLYLIFAREGKLSFGFIKRLLLHAIPAVVLGIFFMWLNFVRFGSIFEFGHNYLAEFVYDAYGQFHVGRVPRNLMRMFFNFDITASPMFHGFAFWLASPIFISYAAYLFMYMIKSIKRAKNFSTTASRHEVRMIPVLLVLVLVHILAFSFHRTLGGHQFGSRYTVDSLVAVYLGLLLILKRMPQGDRIYLNITPMLFGLLLNFYGTIDFLQFYFG